MHPIPTLFFVGMWNEKMCITQDTEVNHHSSRVGVTKIHRCDPLTPFVFYAVAPDRRWRFVNLVDAMQTPQRSAKERRTGMRQAWVATPPYGSTGGVRIFDSNTRPCSMRCAKRSAGHTVRDILYGNGDVLGSIVCNPMTATPFHSTSPLPRTESGEDQPLQPLRPGGYPGTAVVSSEESLVVLGRSRSRRQGPTAVKMS